MSTGIEWVLNPDNTTRGITLNSKTGCLNHVSGMCKGGGFPCYAYKLANGRLKQRYLANGNYAPMTVADIDNPFYPRWWPERLEKIRKLKKPTGIFLDDMSDWMGDYWPEEWTQQELQVMRDCPQHRFYTLTKQAKNLPKWSPFPPNCWVGVTVNRQRDVAQRIPFLLQIEATIRYVSIEPCLGRIDLRAYLPEYVDNTGVERYDLGSAPCNPLDWVIIGSQTKPWNPPLWNWVEDVAEMTTKSGVAVFLKDNLVILMGLSSLYQNLKQEMPTHSHKNV